MSLQIRHAVLHKTIRGLHIYIVCNVRMDDKDVLHEAIRALKTHVAGRCAILKVLNDNFIVIIIYAIVVIADSASKEKKSLLVMLWMPPFFICIVILC